MTDLRKKWQTNSRHRRDSKKSTFMRKHLEECHREIAGEYIGKRDKKENILFMNREQKF